LRIIDYGILFFIKKVGAYRNDDSGTMISRGIKELVSLKLPRSLVFRASFVAVINQWRKTGVTRP